MLAPGWSLGCEEDGPVGEVGRRAGGTGDGSRRRKLSANREIFFSVTPFFFPKHHVSEGKEIT